MMMLKSVSALRLSYLAIAIGSALALSACGDDDNETKIVAVNTDTATNTGTPNNNTNNNTGTADTSTPPTPPKTVTYEQILANITGQGIDLPKVNANLLTLKDKDGKTVVIQQGGYGSDAFVNPNNPKQFYAITDRGPNADVKNGMDKADAKAFPVPKFAPQIGLFELQDSGAIKLIKTITLKRPDGVTEVTGLPNPNFGATNELAYGKNLTGDYFDRLLLKDPSEPYNASLNPTQTDAYGMDSEGLAVMKDGTFWISDEYGPHIVHYDANGKELARINAFSGNEAGASTFKVNGKTIYLPAEFKNRRPNRGMEGLTVTPDQKYLVGIMQSAMENPKSAAKKSNMTRIVRINLATGDIEQFLYRQERAADGSVLSDSNSGLVAINDHEFLVVERDGKSLVDDANATKMIYRIDLNGATNIEAIKDSGDIKQDADQGLMIGGKTLEALTADETGWDTLKANNITPVGKKMFMDLVKTFNYPHEKFEGILLFPNGQVGVINDDDFGISSQNDKANKRDYVTQKYMDKAGTQIETNRIYIAPLNQYQAK